MMKRVALFLLGSLLIAALLIVPAVLIWGEEMLTPGLTAFGVVLVPALATFLWAGWTFRAAPDMALLAGLGGSGVRMFVVLGVGFLLVQLAPATYGTTFLLWLAVFYLLLLALEITLLVQDRPVDES